MSGKRLYFLGPWKHIPDKTLGLVLPGLCVEAPLIFDRFLMRASCTVALLFKM